MAPFRAHYPVPECYVQTLPFPLPSDDVCSDTTYRQDFYAREVEDTLRSTRDAARNIQITKQASHASLLKSTLQCLCNDAAGICRPMVARSYRVFLNTPLRFCSWPTMSAADFWSLV